MSAPAPHSSLPSTSGSRLRQFLSVEAASGLTLLSAAALALVLANSRWAAPYFALWDWVPIAGLTAHAQPVPLRLWTNDGLMSVFFFVVGQSPGPSCSLERETCLLPCEHCWVW